MATKTKKRSNVSKGHQWTPAEERKLHRTVVTGVKKGATKAAMFRAVAEEMQSVAPGLTPHAVGARFDAVGKSPDSLSAKLAAESRAKLGLKPTTRKRPQVAKAKARLKREAAPKPRAAKKAAAPKPVPTASPLDQLQAHIAELEQRATAAENRAAKAEAAAEKLRTKLERVHKLSA